MITPIIIVGIAAWLATAFIGYCFVKKTTFNLLDPLLLVGISIPFSAALLAVLCETGLVPWDKFILFTIVLLGYLAGARTAGAFFSREHFRQLLTSTLSDISGRETKAILLITLGVTTALAILGVQADAQGDARQEFSKIFRPIVVLQSGLFLFSLVLLLTPKISKPKTFAWLLALVLFSIPFSGKGVLVPVVYWFGLKLYLEGKAVTVRAGLGLFIAVLLGVAVSGVLAYGVTGFGSLLYLFSNRLWLSGDVYIYAYQQDALASIREQYPVSFLSYMLHPLTSLIGIRGYEKPLGAMLSSEVTRENLFTGPNPQLPVVLDYFFPEMLLVSLVIAFTFGLLVMGFRPLGIYLTKSRSRYLKLGGIVAAVFCPSAGFQDTSQVLITAIGVAAVTFLGIALEMISANWRNRPFSPLIPNTNVQLD